MLRPVFLDHPDDPDAWEECDEFLLGPDLLVANVLEEGATRRTVRLPRNATGWWDHARGTHHAPGETVTLDVDLDAIPLFVRAGAILPLSAGADRADPGADTGRVLAVFPAPDGTGHGTLYEDDGVSVAPDHSLLRFALECTGDTLDLDWTQEGPGDPVLPRARVVLPRGETRALRVRGVPIETGTEIDL